MSTISKKADDIRDVIKYIKKFNNATIVIYIDEKTIDSPLFSKHIMDIALLHQTGIKVVIIPGARKRIDEILTDSKISWKYHNDIRITSNDAIPLIKMAAFDVSNIIMTSLAANNITALIGNWVRSRAKGIIDGFDYGCAGEIDKLDIDALKNVLENGFIPIFPCIGWNSVGHPYNISSVSLAQQVAISLNADKLFFMIEDGKLNVKDCTISPSTSFDEDFDITAINISDASYFINNNPNHKLNKYIELSIQACSQGVTRVHIVNGKEEGVLPTEIFSNLGSGTMIYTNNYGQIRQMEQSDIPSVLSIMQPFFENGKLLPRTEEQLSAQKNDFYVYEFDDVIHACAALHFYEDNQAEIAAVAVDKNFVHMGIGPKMIHYLIEKANLNNAKSIFILTTQASDWFEKLGFKPDSVDSLPEKRKQLWSSSRNSKVYRIY